jgi:hypothetical protein
MNLKPRTLFSIRSNSNKLNTYKILSVIRREVFKIKNLADGSISILIDRKMAAANIPDSENFNALMRESVDQIITIEGLKTLAAGLLAGDIYLKGKHLSFYLGSKKKLLPE